MRLLASRWLARNNKSDDTPYLIGGGALVVSLLAVGILGLSLLDLYLLRYPGLAAVISSVLVDLANSDRASNDLGGLTVNPLLTEAAQEKANDMAAKGYFAHVSPDGKNSWYWFRQAGYTFLYAGENLAVDFSDSVNVEQAWMNSPTHRANILGAHYTEIGIATVIGTYQGRTTTFVVQMFGSPAKAAAPVKTLASPANPTEPAIATTATTSTSAPGLAVGTSTPPVLGESATGLSAPPSQASVLAHIVASPKTALKWGYYALALLLALCLALVTRLEWKRHHLRHAAAALVIVLLMVGLFTVASLYFFSEPVLAAPAPVTASQGACCVPAQPFYT